MGEATANADDLHVFMTVYAVGGVCPLSGGRVSVWHQVYCLLMLANNWLSVVLMVRDAWEADSAAVVVGRLGLASALWANSFLALGTLARRPRLLQLTTRLQHLPPLPGRHELQRKVTLATFATLALLASHVALEIVYCLLSGNERLLTDVHYPLADKIADPRTRQVVFLAVQAVVTVYQMCNITAFVGLFTYMLLLARRHFTAISDALAQPDTDVDLRAIVQHHQGILSFLNEMEDVYNPLLLLDFLPLVMVICLMIYEIISMEGVDLMFTQTVAIFILYFLNVGAFCFLGTQLTSEAEGVALSAYSSGWEERGRTFSGTILLLILRAQRPFVFTVGKFVPVSITTFSQMIQDAFSYLMVMRTLLGSKDSAPPASGGEGGAVAAANLTLTFTL